MNRDNNPGFNEHQAQWISEAEQSVREWLNSFDSSAPLIVVPVFNAYEDVVECIQSLLKNTPPDVPVLVIDDASTDSRIASNLPLLATAERIRYLRKPFNTGFVDTVNLAFAWSAPRDVVVMNSDVVVPPDWLERLRTAAYYRSTIATATPLTNHGSIVSVPYRNQPISELIGGMTVEEIDARIRAISLRLYPVIPTAIGHCVYFKRSALDVVGYFDPVFAPGYGEEVDFSQRAALAGFSHVVADDLFVYHKGSRSFESRGQEARHRAQIAHENLIRQRYSWYADWSARAATETQSPLGRAIQRAQAALLGYRIAIDATCIGGPVTGTQVLTLELVRALATLPQPMMSLALIVNDHLDRSALLGVDQLVHEVVTLSDLRDWPQPRFDLVHRPFQFRSVAELALLRRVAQRLVVSQLDLIAFSNPGYEANPDEWERYRRLTRLVCSTADGVIFISQDAAQDARHQGIHVESERAFVIPPGLDHLHRTTASMVENESRLPQLPFILMLGTDFRHKNRIYALRLLQALVRKYCWEGRLVLAGPNVAYGGSAEEEALLLQHSPELRSHVCYLGAVSQAEKQWLLKNASLVLYPSVSEGFGLVPFEAAAAGTPALTARVASLSEALGDEVIYLDTFDPEDGADLTWSFLTNAAVATRQVAAIQARMANFTWNAVAAQTLNVYWEILALPSRLHEEIVAPALSADPRHRLLVESKALPSWRRRWALAFYIAFTEGLASLFREIRQYIRWLKHLHA